jgi:lysophospholipid acyltransferase (LPLAT)-like uncharacterized protein
MSSSPSLSVRLLSCFIAGYIRLTYLTTRWEKIGFIPLEAALKNHESIILAFWHGRMAMMPNFAPIPQNIYVMISRHSDGELIARTIEHFDLQLIRGSTNRAKSATKGAKDRGGRGALKDALTYLYGGKTLCITPDGPKGPRMRVVSAVAEIAGHTGAPIYPIAFSTSFGSFLGSWDRFLFPYPFGRGVLVCGKPLKVKKNASGAALEKARKTIENRLNNVTSEADRRAGRVPILPAPME